MLELQDVWVFIGAYGILRGVTLAVPTGAAVGLVGRNGAGKTTTLRSIMGLLPVRSGQVRLDGRDVVRLRPYERARLGIGYMPEDRRLIGPLTVEENILLPAWAMGLPDATKRLRWVYDLMPDVRAMADRRATWLSGGQQKMVALARALMAGRRWLLLDEPFEGLAPEMAARLATVLARVREAGLTILVAESDPRGIAALVDRVVTIERGEIVPDGSALSTGPGE
ncbi:MAG: ABC transporter ATP-binding protein [Acidobacteria bacterium]|nr:ABC transporter ATP-binding protein [Acidobacteriota bacterium]MDW7983738.1 ABC transporter ATP-binding protein [Acidobacteriota bacterium]